MAIYETHCHLNHPQFDDDLEQAIQRALDADVQRLLVVSYSLATCRRAVALAHAYPPLCSAIGIHPEDAAEWNDSTKAELIDLCLSKRETIAAWGEIGLDYHWNTHPHDVQKSVFIDQLVAARSLNLPVIIHCRDAYDDTLDILEQFGADRVVVHCFTGTLDQALRAVSLGYYIGIGGVITYKNAADIREIARQIPLDRMLVETDSPFLAPQSWRGKRNEPAHIVAVVEKLAEVLNMTIEDVQQVTWQNATNLFG
jgi:TatD DNase family protein